MAPLPDIRARAAPWARMAASTELREAVQEWLTAQPHRPEHVSADDWLAFEQDKHQKLLAVA